MLLFLIMRSLNHYATVLHLEIIIIGFSINYHVLSFLLHRLFLSLQPGTVATLFYVLRLGRMIGKTIQTDVKTDASDVVNLTVHW